MAPSSPSPERVAIDFPSDMKLPAPRRGGEVLAALVLAAVYHRTVGRYGPRGERYVHFEIGHAAQNVYLQAGALGLGTTEVGAFDDRAVKSVLGLAADNDPLAIMPIGRRR
jgi:SagB-type dehydrogenase family enzyme